MHHDLGPFKFVMASHLSPSFILILWEGESNTHCNPQRCLTCSGLLVLYQNASKGVDHAEKEMGIKKHLPQKAQLRLHRASDFLVFAL